MTARRLVPHLLGLQLVSVSFAAIVVALVAPPMFAASLPVASVLRGGALAVALVASMVCSVVTLVMTRPLRSLFAAIDARASDLSVEALLGMDALPSRLSVGLVMSVVASTLLMLIVSTRAFALSAETAIALVILSGAVVSMAAVPLYIALRARVGDVLEHAHRDPVRRAIDRSESVSHVFRGLWARLAIACVIPTSFIVLSASLLVFERVQASDIKEQTELLSAWARGVFSDVEGPTRGIEQTLEAATSCGYEASFDLAAFRSDSHTVTVRTPKGALRVRVPDSHGEGVILLLSVLSVLAILIAVAVGAGVGRAFAADVELATKTLRATGLSNVLRGDRMPREPRFASVATVMHAIDDVGDIFREFAAAQQRAIAVSASNERMRSAFLASMSHDLKGPLNAILGFGQLARRGDLTDAQQESLAIIEQRGGDLLELIEAIVDSARLEAGLLPAVNEPIQVRHLLREAVDISRGRTLPSGSVIVLEGQRVHEGARTGEEAIVDGDGHRLSRALVYAACALARLARGITVTVRARVHVPRSVVTIDIEGREATVSVDALRGLFDAFEKTSQARAQGTLGLGLSLARGIVRMHGGSLDAYEGEDDAVGYRIELPLSARSS